MNRQRLFIFVTFVLLVIIGALVFRYAGNNTSKTLKDALPVTLYTLPNGLRVVVVENHRIPAVSHTMFIAAGSADDPAGKSGIAHYLEHLTYKGTETIDATEYDRRLAAMGADNNAFTTSDYTAYYVNGPVEQLDAIMALESDRFTNGVITDSQAVTELEVIKEERKLRVDSDPARQLAEQMDAVQFLMHPYRIPVIGWAQDITNLTAKDARAFIAKHYVASSMVLVVAGDVEPKDVRRLAMRYYGGLKSQRAPKRAWYSEPPAVAARTVSISDSRVKQRQWVRSYTAPSLGTAMGSAPRPDDTVALALAAEWLGGGKTGVLYQALVESEGVAVDVSASYNADQIGPGTFTIHAIPRDGVSMAAFEKVMNEAIASALKAGPDADALKRAKTLYRADIVYAQDGLSPIAMYIGSLIMVGKSEEFFYGLPAMIDAVNADHVQRIAAEVLVRKQSVTGHLLPENETEVNTAPAGLHDDAQTMDLP